jgi:hypothetical protein
MKVNLAAQALSSSVADALEYCEGKLKLSQFQGCGPTVQCIRVFYHLFDNLNSRNPLARNFKVPIRRSNYQYMKRFHKEVSQRGFSMRQVSTISSDIQDEPRSLGIILPSCASLWWVE